MKKPYITRKNLIAIAISALYALLFIFVGFCLTATKDGFISEKNLFLTLNKAMSFPLITLEGVTGSVSLALIGLYIMMFVVALIYVRRYQITNGIKWYNWKILLGYILATVITLGVAVGLTFLININNMGVITDFFTLVGETLLFTTLAGLVLALFVLAIAMIWVNFKKVDKPYIFFDQEKFDDLGEEETDSSVLNSFDEGVEENGPGGAGGSGGDGSGVLSDGSARQLDDREKVFPGLSKIDVDYDGYAIEEIESSDIDLETLLTRFRNYLAKVEKLYYDIDTLRIFIAGLNATRLSILEGLSGTGKSSLPRYFAKFLGAKVTFLPVQVSWRDKTSILGYFNDFSKTYNETDFLLKLYEANYNPDRIHIFVLDEMNISRIEYYFADFLSVLEYPSEQWKIRIMQLPFGFVPPARLDEGYITIPENSFFVGTANKDDSTFSIADKVYDRSTVIAFDNRNEAFEVDGEYEPITLSYSKLKSLFEGAVNDEKNCMTPSDYSKLEKITSFIYDQFEVAFGNRTLNQINNLVPVFVASGGKKEDALDFVIARKVLIKLEGRFEEYVKPALKNLLEIIDEVYGVHGFPLSRKSINSLIRKL